MIPRVSRFRILLLAMLLGLLLPISGCDELFQPSDAQLIRDFAEEWARSKNISPTNADGTPNLGGIANLAVRAAGGSTGDPEADAAIDIAMVVQNIMAADNLSVQARQNGDLDGALKAIQMRPSDYTYRNSKGIALLMSGDPSASLSAFQEADQLAAGQGERAARVNLVDRIVALAASWAEKSPFPASMKQNVQAQFCRDAASYARLTGDSSYVAARPECK